MFIHDLGLTESIQFRGVDRNYFFTGDDRKYYDSLLICF